MIELSSKASGRILEVRLLGELTEEDIENATPMLDERIAEHGKLLVLLRLEKFHGWDSLHAIWDHFVLVKHHHAAVERIAIVGNQTWKKFMATMARPFLKAEERYFEPNEHAKASAWLLHGDD